MKLRLIAVAGGVAGLGALGMIPAHAGVNSAPCSTPGASVPSGANTVPLPATPPSNQGGEAYAGGSATSGGAVGATGGDGYIQAGGSTSGGSISGATTQGPGLNGYVNVGSSPSVCIGNNATSVSAP